MFTKVLLPKYMNDKIYEHKPINTSLSISNTPLQGIAYKSNAPNLKQMYWILDPQTDYVKMFASWSF